MKTLDDDITINNFHLVKMRDKRSITLNQNLFKGKPSLSSAFTTSEKPKLYTESTSKS